MSNFRELSKQNYSGINTVENINCGSLQRIADATELMAKNFLKLQNDYEYLKNRNTMLNTEIESLRRQSAAYKGKFNRLKKMIEDEKKV